MSNKLDPISYDSLNRKVSVLGISLTDSKSRLDELHEVKIQSDRLPEISKWAQETARDQWIWSVPVGAEEGSVYFKNPEHATMCKLKFGSTS